MGCPSWPGDWHSAQVLTVSASDADGSRSGANGIPTVAPIGYLLLSSTDSLIFMTWGFSPLSRSLAEARLRTGCRLSLFSPLVFTST